MIGFFAPAVKERLGHPFQGEKGKQGVPMNPLSHGIDRNTHYDCMVIALLYDEMSPSVLGPCFFAVSWINRFLLAITDGCKALRCNS